MASFLRHQSVRRHASQLWKFVVCGGIGFTIDLLSLTLFVEWFSMDERIAVVVSSIVGATFVFFANKFFTFRNTEQRYGSQITKFALVYGVAIASNAVISNLLLWFGVYYLLAKIIAVAIGAVWNYALSHGFIFKKSVPEEVAIV
jgi:putative flippase GtrA